MFKRRKTLSFEKYVKYLSDGSYIIINDGYYYSKINKAAINANVEILNITLSDGGTCYIKIKYKHKTDYHAFRTCLIDSLEEDIKSINF